MIQFMLVRGQFLELDRGSYSAEDVRIALGRARLTPRAKNPEIVPKILQETFHHANTFLCTILQFSRSISSRDEGFWPLFDLSLKASCEQPSIQFVMSRRAHRKLSHCYMLLGFC